MVTAKVLEYYVEGLSLREIGELTGNHPQALRKALIAEGLAIKVKDRKASYEAYRDRYLRTTTVTVQGEDQGHPTQEFIDTLYEDEKEEIFTGSFDREAEVSDETLLHNRLSKLEHSLQHARNELKYHRATKRQGVVQDSLGDKFTRIMEAAMASIEIPAVIVNPVHRKQKPIQDWGLVAVMSDIHLGESVGDDVPDNTYSYEIAHKRIQHFVSKVISNPQQSKNLVIADLKDILKGVIHGGMWETEGSVIESISQAVEMYVQMITKLTGVYNQIEIFSTGSNHERLTEHIVTTNKHLDYGRLIDLMLKQIIDAKGWDNVTLHSTDNGYNLTSINGANIVMMHGDTLRTYKPTMDGSRRQLQDVCLQIFEVPYRHAISGHTHNFISCTNQYKGMNVVNGTAVGNTSYGLQSGYSAITPSQTILFVEEDGSIENVKAVQFHGV